MSDEVFRARMKYAQAIERTGAIAVAHDICAVISQLDIMRSAQAAGDSGTFEWAFVKARLLLVQLIGIHYPQPRNAEERNGSEHDPTES